MSRPVFSFRPNLENLEHRKAWDILKSVPEGQKNNFLVAAILKDQECNYLEELIRKVVQEELSGRVLAQRSTLIEKKIPQGMLDFLSEIGAEEM